MGQASNDWMISVVTSGDLVTPFPTNQLHKRCVGVCLIMWVYVCGCMYECVCMCGCMYVCVHVCVCACWYLVNR